MTILIERNGVALVLFDEIKMNVILVTKIIAGGIIKRGVR
jgi:hypothetical protein